MAKKIWYLLVLTLVVACSGNEIGDKVPEVSKNYLNVEGRVDFDSDGGSTSLEIKANCNWSISYDVSWLSVSPRSGSGNQTIEVTAEKNNTAADRTAILSIRGGSVLVKTVSITQKKPADGSQLPNQDDNLPPS